MEVKNDPVAAEPLNQFWPRYKRLTIIKVIAVQLVSVSLAAVTFFLLFPNEDMAHYAVLGCIGVVIIALNTLVVRTTMRPVHDLASALTYAAHDPSVDTPPNLNDPYYQKTKLRPLLKMIYDLSMERGKLSDSSTDASVTTVDLKEQLNHTATGLVMFDNAGEIIYANKSAPVMIDAKGKKHLELIFDVDKSITQWINERGEHAIHDETSWSRIANKLTGEQDRRIFDVVASYEKGSEAETIVTLFDRTQTYQPEDDDLDFIAFAAHELRGPITVIRGYLDTLNDELMDQTSQDQKELFQRLIVSANRLSGYVNNILNASRFDRRHLKIHMSEQRVADIYNTIADDMALRAVSQRRLLTVTIPDGLPPVAADVYSMSEVIGNLIDNAIKYSNDGGFVEVVAAANGDFIDVAVTDHGIGMPANVIANLFHKFYRSHRSRETVAGTGIGLYISKAIVESTGGKISVRSVEGRGSTFTVSIPTYASVADKIKSNDINNQGFIERSASGWIKNHGAFRG